MVNGERLGWLGRQGLDSVILVGPFPVGSFRDAGRAGMLPAQWDVGHAVGMSLQVKISYYNREGKELAVAWLYLTCVGRCPAKSLSPRIRPDPPGWNSLGATGNKGLGVHRCWRGRGK